MRRLIGFLIRLYPPEWRERYGDELRALVEDSSLRWPAVLDLFKGGVAMRLTSPSFPRLALLLGLIGMAVAGVISLWIPDRYESKAVMRITGATREEAERWIMMSESTVTSRRSLAMLIQDPRLHLYEKERREEPLEDVEDRMRRATRILIAPPRDPSTVTVFAIGFTYKNAVQAHDTVQALVTRFVDVSLDRARADTGQGSPPPRAVIQVFDPPTRPNRLASPRRVNVVAVGFGGGILLAVLLAPFRRRGSGGSGRLSFIKLALPLSLAGLLIAAAASLLIPNVYQSSATLMLRGEPNGNADEILRQAIGRVTSRSSLSALIHDPNLNLYTEERAHETLEDVVAEMRRDLQFSFGPSGVVLVRFRYPDARAARYTVNAVLADLVKASRAALSASPLEVLDPPTMPLRPISPRRSVIAVAGFAAGLIAATLIWASKRSSPLPDDRLQRG